MGEQYVPGLQPENLITYRFRRIAFGVVSSPSLLTARVAYRIQKELDEALNEGSTEKAKLIEKLKDQIYVDNLIVGCKDEEDFQKLYCMRKEIFAKASSNMRTWSSNIKNIASLIPSQDLETGRHRKY